MKLCEFINICLNEIGVEKVFGVPGSLVMPIWQSISNAEVILCSHEQEASYVANGYAKISKKPTVVITTGGPGVTNCISGIASANIDSVPIIYISGRTPINKEGKGVRQEESRINRMFDSVDLLRNITKCSICISDLETAANEIRDCICQAIEYRQGAVHISVPIDLQNQEISTCNMTFKSIVNIKSEKKINILERPLIIIGWGSWMSNSYEKIYNLAEMINAPILVTSKAYCCIKYEHPHYLGKLGYGYSVFLDDFLQKYNPNTIIAFGTSLGEKDIQGSMLEEYLKKIKTYVVCDDDKPFDVKKYYTISIKTWNVNSFIEGLFKSLPARKYDEELVKMIKDSKESSKRYWKEKISEQDNMAKSIDLLNIYCDATIVVTADAGNHLVNAGVLYDPSTFGGMFLDVGLRAMGNGVCATVGMAIADDTKTYLAITGDGCMLMNGNVMHLAKERDLPIIFVVYNNHTLGRVRVGQSIMNDYRATDINNVNFQLYGKTFGLDVYRYRDVQEFENHIKEIIEKRRTALVELVTDRDEIPLSVKGNIY